MTQEFVSYEQALVLKELGFDELCFGGYDMETLKLWIGYLNDGEQFNREYYYPAPTFSQAFKFFREKHNWQHSIEPTAEQQSGKLGYNYWIWNYKTGEEHYTMPKNRPSGDWEYEVYEEAELACLIKLVEIVKEKI